MHVAGSLAPVHASRGQHFACTCRKGDMFSGRFPPPERREADIQSSSIVYSTAGAGSYDTEPVWLYTLRLSSDEGCEMVGMGWRMAEAPSC